MPMHPISPRQRLGDLSHRPHRVQTTSSQTFQPASWIHPALQSGSPTPIPKLRWLRRARPRLPIQPLQLLPKLRLALRLGRLLQRQVQRLGHRQAVQAMRWHRHPESLLWQPLGHRQPVQVECWHRHPESVLWQPLGHRQPVQAMRWHRHPVSVLRYPLTLMGSPWSQQKQC